MVCHSRNRPSVAQRVTEALGSQIFKSLGTLRLGRLTHRAPLPPGNVPGTHFCYRMSRPQGHGAFGRTLSLKNPVIPPEIDPGNVRSSALTTTQPQAPITYYYLSNSAYIVVKNCR
jgi:hypothetical protein